ncbi:segregation/condensation protein A [soil metagenome]
MSEPRLDPLLVSLDRFQGPLDLLLHLIRKQDIDIFDIPISRITEQFLAVIGEVERLELERVGEFLEMAATLIRIKAQLLFPRRVEEEEDDPRIDLVRRLLEYEHFREVAGVLVRAERERARFFPKGFVAPRPASSRSDAPLETNWSEVWVAAQQLVNRRAEPEPVYRVSGRVVKMDQQIEHILAALREVARVEFGDLISPWGTRMHAVISLLACLELTKRNELKLRQTAPFAKLWVYPSTGEVDAA